MHYPKGSVHSCVDSNQGKEKVEATSTSKSNVKNKPGVNALAKPVSNLSNVLECWNVNTNNRNINSSK